MINLNLAKVNFTKVSFTPSKQKQIYFYDHLEINDNNYKIIANTKISYVKNLYIFIYSPNPNINNYKKLQISKVDLLYINLLNNSNINYFIDLITQLKPKYIRFKLVNSLTIPYLRFPKNICFIFNIDRYKLKTIIHCDEIDFNLYLADITILQLNLNFINTNFKYFKFKKMGFTFRTYFGNNEEDYKTFIKKILKPFPNIKYYDIKLSDMVKEYIAYELTKN